MFNGQAGTDSVALILDRILFEGLVLSLSLFYIVIRNLLIFPLGTTISVFARQLQSSTRRFVAIERRVALNMDS